MDHIGHSDRARDGMRLCITDLVSKTQWMNQMKYVWIDHLTDCVIICATIWTDHMTIVGSVYW